MSAKADLHLDTQLYQKRLRHFVSAFKMLFLLGTASLCAASSGTSVATQPISRLSTPWWRLRFEAKQKELRHHPINLLWLGDSITQDWERSGPQPQMNFAPIWRHFYGDRHTINLGFRGDSTCHLLWRLKNGELNGISPKLAILLVGANNFGHVHTDAYQTYSGIVLIIKLIHNKLPKTKILLLGVLPSIRSEWVDRNTVLLNHSLAILPSRMGSWLRFMNVGASLESNGHVDPSKFIDTRLTPPEPALHPTAMAQEDIARMIEPDVAAMMNDTLHH